MNRNQTKYVQYTIIVVLLIVSFAFISIIFTSINQKDKYAKEHETENIMNTPFIEAQEDQNVENVLEEKDVLAQVEVIADKTFSVEPIDVGVNQSKDSDELESVTIDVPMLVVPVKPDLAQPEQKPETTDDLTNVGKQPEYKEEQTTFIPESEPEPEPVVEEVVVPRGTYLVPDSENPFLQENIPSNGDGGEQLGSDFYQDGNPAGEGDKF